MLAAPAAMVVIARFSSPQSTTACSVLPAALATSALAMSNATRCAAGTSKAVPTSISSTFAPSASRRSRMKPSSSLLVSTVPTSKMDGRVIASRPE